MLEYFPGKHFFHGQSCDAKFQGQAHMKCHICYEGPIVRGQTTRWESTQETLTNVLFAAAASRNWIECTAKREASIENNPRGLAKHNAIQDTFAIIQDMVRLEACIQVRLCFLHLSVLLLDKFQRRSLVVRVPPSARSPTEAPFQKDNVRSIESLPVLRVF